MKKWQKTNKLFKTEQEEMVIRNWCHKSVTIATLLFAVHWPFY